VLLFHGVVGGRNAGCHDGPDNGRCPECRKASRRAFQNAVAARRARFALDPTIVEHGNVTTYRNWGCRCDACREAARLERYRYKFKGGIRADVTKTRKSLSPVTPPFREWVRDA
jgi:hypothetical protein